jgi:tRNA pseudouridine32 synthase/23S rRNA pseudouridine746 synthase
LSRTTKPMRAMIGARPIRIAAHTSAYDAAAAALAHHTRGEILEAFARGDVVAGNSAPLSAESHVRPGQTIWTFAPAPDEPAEPIALPVLLENERFAIIDKPHNLATTPRGSHIAQTVTIAARRQWNNPAMQPAHRLDRETAGLVLLTKSPRWRAPYQQLFQRHTARKTYLAIAPLAPELQLPAHIALRLEKPPGSIAVRAVPGEPNTITIIESVRPLRGLAGARGGPAARIGEPAVRTATRSGVPTVRTAANSADGCGDARWAGGDVVANRGSYGEYRVRPLTGKMHQIRVALSHCGIPLLGDPLYPRVLSAQESGQRAVPLQLLAAELAFTDPVTGEDVYVRSRRRLEVQ